MQTTDTSRPAQRAAAPTRVEVKTRSAYDDAGRARWAIRYERGAVRGWMVFWGSAEELLRMLARSGVVLSEVA